MELWSAIARLDHSQRLRGGVVESSCLTAARRRGAIVVTGGALAGRFDLGRGAGTVTADWSRNDLIAKVRGILPSAFSSMPHSIRLRGPWEYQPLARFVPLATGALHLANDELPP